MPLADTIADITSRLQQGRFPNEQSISQGIVLRLLQQVGWDVYDTNIIWPEFQTGEGRVDFALCHPASKPAVFIEVKQPGKWLFQPTGKPDLEREVLSIRQRKGRDDHRAP